MEAVAAAAQPRCSICNLKAGALTGHLNLHEPQNQEVCVGLEELGAYLLQTEVHYLFRRDISS